MPELKLAKLPDRTPAKITITVSAELNQALLQYAEIYRATYGEAESVTELIPYMLGYFLESDRGFAKARKGCFPEIDARAAGQSPGPQRRDARGGSSVTSADN